MEAFLLVRGMIESRSIAWVCAHVAEQKLTFFRMPTAWKAAQVPLSSSLWFERDGQRSGKHSACKAFIFTDSKDGERRFDRKKWLFPEFKRRSRGTTVA